MQMDKKLKTYRIVPSDSEVYGVSLVMDPAVESAFVALSKQTPAQRYVAMETDEKRMLYGVVLRADFPIYRDFGDEQCYITFDAKCIERLEQKFFKHYSHQNWSKDHMEFATGLTMTESWLVTDPECDKAKAVGLSDYGAGDWIGGCKVDDDDLWHDIKEGRFTGFSVESFVALDEIVKEIKDKTKETDMAVQKQVNCETVEVNEGFWDKVEAIVRKAMGKAGDDEQAQEDAAAEAVEEIQEEAGAQGEQTEETVEAAEETPAETPEEVAEEAIAAVEEAAGTPEEAQEDLQAVVDRLNEEIKAKDEEIAELKKANNKMAKQLKQPSVKPVVDNKQSAQGDWRTRLATVYSMD